ncbi:MAG: hypothetical protein OXM61_07105 [Candidatus Poribacteria bacterium]|nr:hypothetical protein [Candidatus Poribacteria bacterium]
MPTPEVNHTQSLPTYTHLELLEIVCCILEDMKSDEIAERLGKSTGWVKKIRTTPAFKRVRVAVAAYIRTIPAILPITEENRKRKERTTKTTNIPQGLTEYEKRAYRER